MILATPIFYPAVLKLSFDPIWFGIMIGVTVPCGHFRLHRQEHNRRAIQLDLRGRHSVSSEPNCLRCTSLFLPGDCYVPAQYNEVRAFTHPWLGISGIS
jgi:hypothetical protein